jgi:hypothetical protein
MTKEIVITCNYTHTVIYVANFIIAFFELLTSRKFQKSKAK